MDGPGVRSNFRIEPSGWMWSQKEDNSSVAPRCQCHANLPRSDTTAL